MMTMDSGSEGDLPRGIALAWGVAANPQRGPRRELTLEGIVEAAVRIADADGIGAVSMASVAAALGFTTMSLYRYVSAKDDLLLLMQESGIGLPPLDIGVGTGSADAADWRDGLTRWYRAVLEGYSTHPWLLDIPLDTEPNTPNNLAWLDAGLSALTETPLAQTSRVSALLLLSAYSRWAAQLMRNHDGPTIPPAALAELVTPEQFPFLAPAIAAGAFSDGAGSEGAGSEGRGSEGAGDALDFGLFRILDGLEAHIRNLESGTVAVIPAPDARAVELAKNIARDERVKNAADRVKDAEGKLRDARQKQREAEKAARDRLS